MSKKVLMTFDLKDADPSDYPEVYDALVGVGLSRLSQNQKLRLPASTVFGTIESDADADTLRRELTSIVEEAAGHKVGRMMVAIVKDWSCSGYQDLDLWLDELLAEVMAMEAKALI